MKRALIICYYWPPAGGPGVQRWLKFVKYLRDYDVEPVLYVPENPHYPIEDKSLEAEIPDGITILKRPIREPYALAKLFSKKETSQISSGIIKAEEKQSVLQKLMLFVRGNLFIPDARKWWIKPSVTYLSDYLKNNPVDCIITTGPPHSLHLIGLGLKKRTGLPWLADFRDPWTTIGYHDKLKLTAYAKRKHKELEAKVFNTADHLVVTSPATKLQFEKHTQKPVTCITNGFDNESVAAVPLDKAFSLAHIGSLLEDRNPQVLWEILNELKSELPGFKEDLKIKLAGKVSASVISQIKAEGLAENLEVLGYISHKEALVMQRSSQLLLLIEIDKEETQVIIPGKLFEYLAARRPILALGPQKSDIRSILNETEAGSYFEYSQKQALKNTIAELYKEFKTTGLHANSGAIDHYSRSALTHTLATVLHQL